MPLGVWAIVRLSWGMRIRPPATSAGGPSLPLPPPSTVIGALARGIASIKGWGEMEGEGEARSTAYRLAKHVLAAGAGILEGFVALYSDTMRYLSIPYMRRENRRQPSLWFGAQAFGVAMAANSRLCLAASFSDSLIDEGIGLRDLEAAAWGLTCLGSKEGIVSVEEAGAGVIEASRGGVTGYYLPAEALEYVRHEVAFRAWDPRDPNAYIKPWRRGTTKVKPLDLRVPIRLSLGRDVLLGHEGEEALMARVKGDVQVYKIPGPCGVLVSLE